MKDKIIKSFQLYWENFLDTLPDLLVALVLLLFFLLLAAGFRRLVDVRLSKRIKDRLLLNFVSRVVFLIFLVLGIVVFLNQVGLGGTAKGLLAGAGVSALILGFAFKDIGENFIAGFFLAFSRPFSIGDIIEVNGLMGAVKAMSFRNSHIRTYDGRDIFIPNAIIIKNPLINFTKDGLIRHDFSLGIDYKESIADAMAVVMKVLKANSSIPQEKELAPFVIIDKFGVSTIDLKIFFWINTFNVLESNTVLKSDVMQSVINALLKEGFNLPADIVELKMYEAEDPLHLTLKQKSEE